MIIQIMGVEFNKLNLICKLLENYIKKLDIIKNVLYHRVHKGIDDIILSYISDPLVEYITDCIIPNMDVYKVVNILKMSKNDYYIEEENEIISILENKATNILDYYYDVFIVNNIKYRISIRDIDSDTAVIGYCLNVVGDLYHTPAKSIDIIDISNISKAIRVKFVEMDLLNCGENLKIHLFLEYC